jgi:uracil-DNA glycosylase
MVIQAAAGQRLVDADPARAKRAFAAISESARQGTKDLERLIELLGGSEGDVGGGPDLSLVDEVVARAGRSGLNVTCRFEGDRDRVPEPVAHLAFRVVQESLTNALRYAPGADVHIVISIDQAEHGLAVRVENDRAAQNGAPLAGTGRGLVGLRERIQTLGGQFSAGTTGVGGWVVEADTYDNSPGPVFPERSDLFRAFHLTSLGHIRVVILGQDPYPRPKQAHGLAFSVPNGVAIPRSLKAICTNLENDPALNFSRPQNGDLTSWAKDGVLLLNTALTVEEGGRSHARRWKHFTDLVLQVINEECAHVAFLLWGSPAISQATSIPINEPPHRVIRSAHPAARGKTNEARFEDRHPFSEANDFLTSHKLEPVIWDLPAAL